MSKPAVIGITLDSQTSGGYAEYPWYALRQNYFDCVTACGAIPLALPHQSGSVDAYLELVDGLLVPGGDFDIPPSLYGDIEQHEAVTVNEGRTQFEWEITKKALEQNMPILGICAGQQLLNVILGGTLIQHIPDEVENALEHEQRHNDIPSDQPSHAITITEGTLLHKITGVAEMEVNSSHHQAAKEVGEGVVINAVASDGVIEGIEYPEHPFCLGVEWHPEFAISEADKNIFKAFVEAAKG